MIPEYYLNKFCRLMIFMCCLNIGFGMVFMQNRLFLLQVMLINLQIKN